MSESEGNFWKFLHLLKKIIWEQKKIKITLATGFLGNCNSPMSKLKLNWKFSISRFREKKRKRRKKIFLFSMPFERRSGTEKCECGKNRIYSRYYFTDPFALMCVLYTTKKRINWDEKRKEEKKKIRVN